MSSNKIDEQEERWGKRNKEKAEIQQLYEFNEKHFDQGSEVYGQLIAAVENYSSKAIWAVLNNSPYNTREDYEDVIMRGRESFLQENNNVFFNYKNKEDVRKTVMFSDYARGMYQKKAFDHIKKRKRNSEVDPVPEDIYIENGYNNQIPSAGEVLIDYYAKAVMNSDAILFSCATRKCCRLCWEKLDAILRMDGPGSICRERRCSGYRIFLSECLIRLFG